MSKSTVRSTYSDRKESVPLATGRMALIVGFVGILIVATFGLGLWMFRARTNFEGEVRRESFNFQQTAREQVVDFNTDLGAIDVQLTEPSTTDAQTSALSAQRIAIADQLCDVAADITGSTSRIVDDIIAKEC